MNKTRIWTAYQWTCDECGKDNFERAIAAELTPEERQEIADDQGLDLEYMRGDFVLAPEVVKCGHCGEQFETEDAE